MQGILQSRYHFNLKPPLLWHYLTLNCHNCWFPVTPAYLSTNTLTKQNMCWPRPSLAVCLSPSAHSQTAQTAIPPPPTLSLSKLSSSPCSYSRNSTPSSLRVSMSFRSFSMLWARHSTAQQGRAQNGEDIWRRGKERLHGRWKWVAPQFLGTSLLNH